MRPAIAILVLAAWLQPAPPPGFTLTFAGDAFTNTTFVIKPMTANGTNNYWESTRDPRVKRLDFGTDAAPGQPELKFGVPAQLGTFAFDRSIDPQNPYLSFELDTHDVTALGVRRLDLIHVEVTITRMDAVGGRLEGTVNGRYEACTPDPAGGGACTNRVPVTLTGRFSVVREKDRRVR